MPCRRCLFSKIMAVIITLIGVTASPFMGRAQTTPRVTEQDIAGLIIAMQEDRVSVSAGDTVILDQGRARGVEVGDRYAVFQDSRTSVHPFTGRLIWPLIYKANSQQIRDPDLIFPKQIFVIPRDYTPEEAVAAMQRSKQRGAWRLGDGR